jgi:hypothetical protein
MKPIAGVATLTLLALLAVVVARQMPATASVNPGVPTQSARSCVDRYNSLLEGAKADLAAGDRAATVDLLQRAKGMISSCPGLQDETSQTTVL